MNMQRIGNQNISDLPLNSKYRESCFRVRLFNRPIKGFKLIEEWQMSGENFLDHVAVGKKTWAKNFPKYKSHIRKYFNNWIFLRS